MLASKQRPDIWPWQCHRDDNGQLIINNIGVSQLVNDYSSPIYVLDLDDFISRARIWRSAMDEAFWDGYGMNGAKVYYAGKAFLCKAIACAMADEGLGIDTASLGELRLALSAGVAPSEIGLHGNNKSDEVLTLAIEKNIGRVVIDSLEEIDRIDAIAAKHGTKARVMVRVTTGVHAGGHEFIATAHEDQKFGLSLANGMALEAVTRIAKKQHLTFIGLHSHIGSQITNLDAFTQAAKRLLGLRKDVLDLNISCHEVDLGGGYAIAYSGADDVAPSQKIYADSLADIVRSTCQELGTDVPEVSIEPGRSIAGPSTVTLYRVGTIKDVQLEDGSTRRYVSIDGGMSDNIRPALYGATYTCVRANRDNVNEDGSPASVRCRVVGSHCESGDIIINDVYLPDDLRRNDIIAVPATGAYGRSMASNYNMMPTPAVVGVQGGRSRLLVKSRNVDDLLAEDCS